jgi:uncharacterized repeat protein (TIGR01451 family)
MKNNPLSFLPLYFYKLVPFLLAAGFLALWIVPAARAETEGGSLHLGIGGLPGQVQIGHSITYTLVVTNTGQSEMLAVAVTNTLSGGMQIVTPTLGSGCTLQGGDLACLIPILPGGSSQAFSVKARAAGVGPADVRARARSVGEDTGLVSQALLVSGERISLPGMAFGFRSGGQLLYQDDFSGGNLGWTLHPPTSGAQIVIGGEYSIISNHKDVLVISTPPLTPLPAEFELEVKARSGTSTLNIYGLMFNWNDNSNFYVFFVDPATQSWAVFKYKSAWIKLIGWSESSFILADGGVNRLKVRRSGNLITPVINGHPLTSVVDGDITEGQAGLILWNQTDLVTQALFDDFMAWGY